MSIQELDVPRSTTTADKVATLWAELLELPAPPESQDNFFDLGGDSLAVMMVIFRVNEEFGIEVATDTLLESPTLENFCQALDAVRAEQSASVRLESLPDSSEIGLL
jgi:acyl carrier protein